MRYHLSNGQWRKKIFGQRTDKSSSEDEDEDDEKPHEFATTVAASTQEEEIQTQGPIDTTVEPTVPAPPTMEIPISDTTQTPIIEPSVSQSYTDNQMR